MPEEKQTQEVPEDADSVVTTTTQSTTTATAEDETFGKQILTSASRMVFLILAVTACAGFLLKILPVDQFMLLSVSAFSFYFSNKGDENRKYLGK